MRTCSMCYSNLQIPKLGLQLPSLGLTSLGRRATITTISQPLLECFRSIQYSDAPAKILDNEFLKHFVKVFGLDLETTGLSRKEGRIVEIAVRDLHGGKNSCFQTLVNPEQHVPNSHIHGIGVTFRCPKDGGVDSNPCLVEYIKSRQVPGGQCYTCSSQCTLFRCTIFAQGIQMLLI
ncbi:PREDICTED: exonuclease DPD1 [Prunus dulcis]|uniref:PREDICTED: exonuclease DPD1 n=1 Tax=Prunus dulcis TaxID=3755 RepID=A0A5E4F9P2_PRUDU|nr:PREDICTED: exonuclease DPD1 [Prunus dulcis]